MFTATQSSSHQSFPVWVFHPREFPLQPTSLIPARSLQSVLKHWIRKALLRAQPPRWNRIRSVKPTRSNANRATITGVGDNGGPVRAHETLHHDVLGLPQPLGAKARKAAKLFLNFVFVNYFYNLMIFVIFWLLYFWFKIIIFPFLEKMNKDKKIIKQKIYLHENRKRKEKHVHANPLHLLFLIFCLMFSFFCFFDF